MRLRTRRTGGSAKRSANSWLAAMPSRSIVDAELAPRVMKVRERIDAEDFDDELGHVLDVGFEDERLARSHARVGLCAHHASSTRSRSSAARRRAEHARRLICVAGAGEQLGGGELGVEPRALELARESLGIAGRARATCGSSSSSRPRVRSAGHRLKRRRRAARARRSQRRSTTA